MASLSRLQGTQLCSVNFVMVIMVHRVQVTDVEGDSGALPLQRHLTLNKLSVFSSSSFLVCGFMLLCMSRVICLVMHRSCFS